MALKNKAISLVVFMFFLNAVPGLMVASGISADMGVTPSVSGGNNIDDANEAAQSFEPSGGFGSTLFSLYTSAGGFGQTILGVLIGGELMFMSLGVPGWLIGFMFAPKYLLVFGGLIYIVVGRRM